MTTVHLLVGYSFKICLSEGTVSTTGGDHAYLVHHCPLSAKHSDWHAVHSH